MVPWEHYIPVNSDASDFNQVLEVMNDSGRVQKMIQDCRSAILDADDLRASTKAKNIIQIATTFVSKKNVKSSCDGVDKVINRYKNEMTREKYEGVWRRRRIRQRVVRALNDYPQVLRMAKKAYTYVNRR